MCVKKYIRSVTGSQSAEQRKDILQWFSEDSSDLRILCNVAVVKEGVDVPVCDMVVFCDDKQSPVQIV